VFFYYILIAVERFHDWPYLGGALFSLAFFPVTVVKMVGLVTVITAIFAPRPDGAVPRHTSTLGIVFVAFAVVPVLATVGSGLPLPESLSNLISLLLLLVATRRLISTYPRVTRTIRAVVIVAAISTFWSFKQALLEGGRTWGVNGDPNYEALTLVMMIPLALWMVRADDSPRWRHIGMLSAVLLAAAVILTQSRGALIGLGIVALGELFGRRRPGVYKAALVAVTLFGLVSAPSALWNRLENVQVSGEALNGDTQSTEARYQILIAGLNMVEAHPFFGVGLDLFKPLSPKYNPRLLEMHNPGQIAHNTYMQAAAEGGLITLALFLILMALGLHNCRVVAANTKQPEVRQLASAIRMSIFAFATASFFLSANYLVFFWLIIFLSQNLRHVSMANVTTDARTASRTPNRSQPNVLCASSSAA
jgi:O-antigen ligase